jgi:hypothetical protein
MAAQMAPKPPDMHYCDMHTIGGAVLAVGELKSGQMAGMSNSAAHQHNEAAARLLLLFALPAMLL